jgi:hypothetical protein
VDSDVWIVAIVIGVPVVCGIGAGIIHGWMKMRLKYRELEVQQQKLLAEERLRTDELNAKILKMDDFGLSPVEIASLAEDVRRLREEVAALRQEMSSRAGEQSTHGGT